MGTNRKVSRVSLAVPFQASLISALLTFLFCWGALPVTTSLLVPQLALAQSTPPEVVYGQGKQWFAATNGSSSGDGSIEKPWDLPTALKAVAIKPGDILWLRGGTYVGAFTSTLNGTAAAPIVVRNYAGETVKLDGNDGKASKQDQAPVLMINGTYTWFWGLEFLDTSLKRRTLIDPRLSDTNYWDAMADVTRRRGITHVQDGASGTGCRFINLIVHDTKDGFSLWLDAKDTEVYGSLVYNVGYVAPDRGHGHGFYLQNLSGTKWIRDNVTFNNYDNGVQVYGSGAAHLQNFYLDGNSWSNAGVTSNTQAGNIVIYGGDLLKNIHVTSNYTYATPERTTVVTRIGLHSPQEDAEVRNNFFANQTDLRYWDSLQFTDNLIVANNSAVNFYTAKDPRSGGWVDWDRNTYFAGPTIWGHFALGLDYLSPVKYYSPKYTEWQTVTGFDAHSTYLEGLPKQAYVYVRPNKYEPGRAQITIFNYPKSATVALDLSKAALANGDNYLIRNAQDIFGDSMVVQGVFDATQPVISFPMTGWKTPVTAIGGDITPPATLPEFGMFLLFKTGQSVKRVAPAAPSNLTIE